MNDWHIENKAEFENVGQWKRAWYYTKKIMKLCMMRFKEKVKLQEIVLVY